MTQDPRNPGAPDGEEGGDFNDPDRQNAEQNEEGSQAQDIADEALHQEPGVDFDSEPGSRADIADVVPRDVPDLVSIQKDMTRSGHIDMNAFAGEEKMDDEDE